MDARREPRFSIYGPVKATLLSSPERALDCVLLDISATGLKLIAPESIAVDEILSIEAEDHLALADVRYVQPRGDKFTIGCERIHVLNKVPLPDDKVQVDQIRLLIDDYRNRIRNGIATERPDTNEAEAARLDRQILQKCEKGESPAPTPVPEHPVAAPSIAPDTPSSAPPAAGKFTTREQLLDAAAAWAVEHWEKIPASPRDATAGRSEIIDRLTVHLAEKLRPSTPPPPEKPPEKIARKIRPTTKQNVNVRQWRIPIGLAAAAILGWGLSAIFWSLNSSGAAGHLHSSISALISAKDLSAPAPTSSVRHAMIKVVEATWIIATSDGKRLFNKKLAKDDIREIEFSDKALLRIGNAKGVEISLDGKPIGPIGGRGQARLVELSAAGFRLLPLN
ncbi:MAG TPA: RodZ domain-containing protein [Bryobacteraceae bacterium]|jgi:hypothetical protein|nr:RodZ domain-containing protein [Bryobacteraceae bacterium]